MDMTAEVRPDDEVESTLEPGDIHAFIVPLVAGSRLTVDLDARGEDDGPAPEMVLFDPGGAELARTAGLDARIRRDIPESGRYRVEVRARDFEGDYEIDFDTELPSVVGDEKIVTGDGSEVHLDVPAGASVRIEVRRKSGAPPEIRAVRDGTGRSLGVAVKKASKKRVRLHPLPVTAPGGLYVEVAARDGTSGTYEVRAKLSEEWDEEPDDGDDDDNSPRRLVLFLEPGADPAAVAAALGYELKEVRDGHIIVETGEDREGFEDEDARKAVESRPEVVGAEPDALTETPEGSQSNGIALGSSLGLTDFRDQPAFLTVRGPTAHESATGDGIVVAVLDTGIDATHSLFAGHLAAGYDFVDGDADPTEERNLLDDDGDGEIDEGYGHGTFVAGLVLGGAPGVTILPVRVLDSDGHGEASDIAAGIEFAVANGADVINLSLGARQRSEVLRGAVRFAMSHGVDVVAATGNGADLTAVDFPSGVSGVVAVTALDAAGGRAPFANASPATTLAAPGVALIGPHPGEQWGTWSGTSFATALVSAGTALLLESRPDLGPTQVRKKLVKKARSVKRQVPAAERKLMGGGRLDLARLVR